MIILILRDTIQQTIYYFQIVMRIVYPPKCLDVYKCQQLFRQKVLNKFSTYRIFFVTVRFVDGGILRFETQLNGMVENYGKNTYTSGDNILARKTLR